MVSDCPWGTRAIYTRTNPFQFFFQCFASFHKKTGICNFVDDTTLYASGKDLDTISYKLEIETNRAMQWLKDNKMVANPSKFQLMFLSCTKTSKQTCL